MKMRCKDYGSPSYKYYGLRGISVCKRWDESFFHFISDMGMKPDARYSLDRIDNNGDYSPDNCRWATPKEQNNNKRTNKPMTFEGQTKNISEWAKHFDVGLSTLYSLLSQYDIDTAFQVLKRYS